MTIFSLIIKKVFIQYECQKMLTTSNNKEKITTSNLFLWHFLKIILNIIKQLCFYNLYINNKIIKIT